VGEKIDMSDTVSHCPFLNRSDSRCSEAFKLDHLRRALQFCFDQYQSCPVYGQLLTERQARRSNASNFFVQISLPAQSAQSAQSARHAQPQRAVA